MTKWKSALTRSLALLLMTSLLSLNLNAVSAAESSKRREFQTLFEVTIHEGPSAGLEAYGLLTLHVNPGTGNFTGDLTPAIGKDTGEPLPTVLFIKSGETFVPDPSGVTEIEVRGTFNGHAVNMIMLNVRGDGKHIVGVGTTENNTGRGFRNDPGSMGGPAIGPETGDRGDWLEPCCQKR